MSFEKGRVFVVLGAAASSGWANAAACRRLAKAAAGHAMWWLFQVWVASISLIRIVIPSKSASCIITRYFDIKSLNLLSY